MATQLDGWQLCGWLYLDDLEPFLVVLWDFVRSDELDVAAVARVAHDVVLNIEHT